MANGFSGSKADFDRLEAPLKEIDPELTKFAAQHGMKVGKNYHNWPERSLTWTSENRKLIQIFLADEKRATYHLWLCASKDIGNDRLWKQKYLFENQPFSVFVSNLQNYLDEAFQAVNSWKDQDLMPSGKRENT